MRKKILVLFVIGIVLAGCKKNLSPLDDNHRTLQAIYNDPYYAEGILMPIQGFRQTVIPLAKWLPMTPLPMISSTPC